MMISSKTSQSLCLFSHLQTKNQLFFVSQSHGSTSQQQEIKNASKDNYDPVCWSSQGPIHYRTRECCCSRNSFLETSTAMGLVALADLQAVREELLHDTTCMTNIDQNYYCINRFRLKLSCITPVCADKVWAEKGKNESRWHDSNHGSSAQKAYIWMLLVY